jgi:predicted nucleotidyltransferase
MVDQGSGEQRLSGDDAEVMVRIILAHYPRAQAIYLLGTYGTEDARPDSDVDLAVLLPRGEAKQQRSLLLTPCHHALMEALDRPGDLLRPAIPLPKTPDECLHVFPSIIRIMSEFRISKELE